MDIEMRDAIGRQLEASIQMLENALQACPDKLWRVQLWPVTAPNPVLSEFWYILNHTLFWLDLYLSGSVEGFSPPEPFTLDELDPAGLTPAIPYTKDQLQSYLEYDRARCRRIIESMTDEKAQQKCRFPWGEVTYTELLLDTMRHVQEHTAQLNMILGQRINFNPGWIVNPRNINTK